MARVLASCENAIFLLQSELLNALVPSEITDMAEFVEYFSRLKSALTLENVLGYCVPIERTDVEHELELVDTTDKACNGQLA